MGRNRVITTLLVFLAAAPAAAIAIWSISRTVIRLADPCVTWGYPPDRPVYVHVGPHDACREPGVTSQSKLGAAVLAALVPGGVLTAALLAVAAAVLSRRRMMVAAAITMLAETLVVFTVAPLTLIAGLSFLFFATRLQPAS
jgi:hypothetical protein